MMKLNPCVRSEATGYHFFRVKENHIACDLSFCAEVGVELQVARVARNENTNENLLRSLFGWKTRPFVRVKCCSVLVIGSLECFEFHAECFFYKSNIRFLNLFGSLKMPQNEAHKANMHTRALEHAEQMKETNRRQKESERQTELKNIETNKVKRSRERRSHTRMMMF
jgi:hypothetical protein